MKIEKFNENQQQDELDEFIEMIINKFYPNDDLNNMASYNCEFATVAFKKVRLNFHFMVLDEDEIKIMQDIVEYIRLSDKDVMMYIRASNIKNMTDCIIDIQLSNYGKVYKALEAEHNAKKYNL